MQINSIPLELRGLTQWVCWKYVETDSGKPTKVPYSPLTKTPASVIDPNTWGTFIQAIESSSAFDGIGMVLTENDPYTIIDLDTPKTPEQEQRHQRIVDSFISYTEISPSGTGLHIVVKGAIPAGLRKDNVEIYSDKRYMTFTGNIFRDSPINDYNSLLQAMATEMQQRQEIMLHEEEEQHTDKEIYEMASYASNGDKYTALCNGNWQSSYPSQSEADFALLSLLAFYTKSNAQVRRLFRYTALGKRQKAVVNDVYIDRCLRKIRASEAPPVDFTELYERGEIASKENIVQRQVDRTTCVFPPGLVGRVADYIYSSSIRPVREASLIAAMGLISGVSARAFNISATGLNQYLIFIADTGIGKEGIQKGIDKLILSVADSGIPAAFDLLGPSHFGSGQGLVKELDARPCFLSILGEFGTTLEQINDPRASAPTVMLRKVLLDLYTKSGADSVLQPTAYSDSSKNTKAIRSPSVSLLAETTPVTFYPKLGETQIASGLLPRFSIVEYLGDRMPKNPNAHHNPDPELVKELAALFNQTLTLQHAQEVVNVGTTPAALDMLDAFDRYADNEINKKGTADVSRQLWNRAHLKALKVSATIAVGCDPIKPVIDEEMAKWAIDFVNKDVTLVLDKFNEGGIGFGTEKQEQQLKVAVLDYLKFTKKQKHSYSIPKKLIDSNLIPYSYLRKKLLKKQAFVESRMGASKALEVLIKDLLKADILTLIPPHEAKTVYNTSCEIYGLGNSWS